MWSCFLGVMSLVKIGSLSFSCPFKMRPGNDAITRLVFFLFKLFGEHLLEFIDEIVACLAEWFFILSLWFVYWPGCINNEGDVELDDEVEDEEDEEAGDDNDEYS